MEDWEVVQKWNRCRDMMESEGLVLHCIPGGKAFELNAHPDDDDEPYILLYRSYSLEEMYAFCDAVHHSVVRVQYIKNVKAALDGEQDDMEYQAKAMAKFLIRSGNFKAYDDEYLYNILLEALENGY